MPILTEKDMQIKLNSENIENIMAWFQDITARNGLNQDGYALTQEDIDRYTKKLRSVLPNVPAIYLELINNVVLDNTLNYEDLDVEKPEHPAYHIEVKEVAGDIERSVGYGIATTGDYATDTIFRARTAGGRYAITMFEALAHGAYKLVDIERAKEYYRTYDYKMEEEIAEADAIMEEVETAMRETPNAINVKSEKEIFDDFRSSTAAYKDALMTKKERLDTELKEKKAQIAEKKQADKEFRRDVAKMAHPINFIARWALRINYRIQQHDNRKETLDEFKKSQKEEREEIEATLRTLDQNAKDIDKSIKKDAPWREAAEQFTSEYQSNTLDEREVHNEWLNEREERREEAERMAEKNRQLDEQFRAREAYEDSFYEQPEEKKSAFRGKSLFSENAQTKGSANRNRSKQKELEKTKFLD